MIAKALELRDRGTFIPLLAVDMNPRGADVLDAERYLLRRCGYPCDGAPNILITRLAADGTPAANDPDWWPDRLERPFSVAHKWIIENWHKLKDGDVVDVEFILGERAEPKISERFDSVPTLAEHLRRHLDAQ
jgi:hypothetical protein